MIAPVDWRWFGRAGHLIVADRCRFHLHTHVGPVCVSTVGEYFPLPDGPMDEIGVDRLYETMVFRLGDDDAPSSWESIDFGGYNDLRGAEAGHLAMCRRWAEEQP